MKLVIGLGNPGDRYMNNRRNIGFKIVDVLANNMNIQIKTKKKKSLLGVGDFEGHKLVLLKPQTFMNLSGEAVLYIASFLRVPVANIIVIHDDYSLDYTDVVVARGALEIPHEGVQSIIEGLKSDRFVRIRVGIGPIPRSDQSRPPTEEEIQKHLMSDFHMSENMRIIEVINDAEAALRSILTQDIEDVLSRYRLGRKIK
ncbi:MAG: aminoacyl-tRNA hydrolase [Leptospiraceae bacterium]|nr:aminoacyl-tRNA hydrolase [Leptospiraceae bacterium]MDW8306654.1 aminoacyl-tRNA hydrolase [Leptospiraceae bacterium]